MVIAAVKYLSNSYVKGRERKTGTEVNKEIYDDVKNFIKVIPA